ncbi:MAG: HAD-IIA family hydrolase [Lapillicoccus sp.]
MAEPVTLAEAYRGIVCDLDGVVRRGSTAVPHAVEQVTALTIPVVFATNNASLTPDEVARQLIGLGLSESSAYRDAVVTSSQAGATFVAAHHPRGSVVLAVGGPGVAVALVEVGMTPVTRRRGDVVAVLQGYGPDVTATDLAHASYAIQDGAQWVATNRDATLPTENGVAPGNGALIAAVALATGSDPVAVGKPEPPLYDLAVSRLGCAADQALAVGDRLDTDIVGAMAAGLDSLWVLSGVDSLATFACAAGRPVPTFTATDLRALGRPAQRVQHTDGAWVCGPVRLSVDWTAGSVAVDPPDPTTDVVDRVDATNALASAAVAALVHGRDREGVPVDRLTRIAHQVTAHLHDGSA